VDPLRSPDAAPAGDSSELEPPELDSPELDSLLRDIARAPERDPDGVAAALGPGVIVGRFELLRVLGQGGFGVVFEARDRELNRLVAFKAMRASRAGADALVKPLHEEAEAAARLNHPNVVTLHDYGIHQGTPYLILELLRGETLQERLRRGPLTLREGVRVALDVARGLVHAHGQGVLHRDLKPGNVFLTEDGSVKILDFGLARLLDHAALPGGTPAYMAPEQLKGEPGDARTDVFALGVVLFQALTGILPYTVGGGRSAVLDPGPPPPLPLAWAPPELASLVAGALSKDPTGRPQGAHVVRDTLLDVERGLAERAVRAARHARRQRFRVGLAAAVVFLLAIATLAAYSAVDDRAQAERALLWSRVASAADGASDPLLTTLLLAELPDDPPPRTVEIAERVLSEPIPLDELALPPGGSGLAVSPDGVWLAVGLADGGVALWRTDGTQPPRLVPGGGKDALSVRFTPDGRNALSASRDGVVRVFPVDGDGPPRVLAASGAPLVALDVDRTGRLAAAAGVDGRVWLFDVASRRLPRTLVHDGAVFAVAWSPDGALVATGCADGVLRTFDAAGEPVTEVDLRAGAILAVAWAPDGRLAAVGEDGVTRIVSRWGEVSELGVEGGPATAVTFDPGGQRTLTALADGTARVRGAAGQEIVLRGHRGPVLWGAFLPAGRRVLTVSADGTARIWRADGAGAPMVLRGQVAQEAVLSPDGGRIFTKGQDGTVRVWTTVDPRERNVLRGHELPVTSVGWTHDGRRVITAGQDGTARVWAVHGGEPLVMSDPGRTLHAAELDPGEALLLTASEDGVARLWNAASGALLRELRGHEGPVLAAEFSPDGRWIATGSIDRTVRLWRTDGTGSPTVLRGHAGAVTGLAWMPDGSAVVSASAWDGTIRVWDRGGGDAVQLFQADRPVIRPAVAPDGALLVAEQDGLLRRFRRSGLELPPLPSPPEGLLSAVSSADGHRLALGSSDGSVRVYTRGAGAEPLLFREHDGPVDALAFNPDGTELATASRDGTARVFTVDWPRLRAQLRAATSACLRAETRVQLLREPPAVAAARAQACKPPAGGAP
jgi:WD40 repeat protein